MKKSNNCEWLQSAISEFNIPFKLLYHKINIDEENYHCIVQYNGTTFKLINKNLLIKNIKKYSINEKLINIFKNYDSVDKISLNKFLKNDMYNSYSHIFDFFRNNNFTVKIINETDNYFLTEFVHGDIYQSTSKMPKNKIEDLRKFNLELNEFLLGKCISVDLSVIDFIFTDNGIVIIDFDSFYSNCFINNSVFDKMIDNIEIRLRISNNKVLFDDLSKQDKEEIIKIFDDIHHPKLYI